MTITARVATILGVVAVTSCSVRSNSSPPPENTSTSTSTRVTPLPDPPERQAIDAYLAMWREMAIASETSNSEAPGLAEHAAGDALVVIKNSLAEDEQKGLVTRGSPKSDPQVTNVDRSGGVVTVVKIRDCGDDSAWLKYRKGTNQPADGQGGGRRSILAEVKAQPDGSWRVTRFAVQGVGSC
ncbi:hypothetical protein SAMN05216188_107317 [Lentzea xinjiangensis]|uniref:Secreted protein/lipoprotein n=1 Tax=Lentzea xinjiangensis TaxID=402600 RepID=A0A1H9L9L7_9PSEU|nr:hypothetical protein [Lentzea xinjiangensis]SER07919.1 hypothetical protein SAMN05216188_107317 [Lentzea xinjiangensis]